MIVQFYHETIIQMREYLKEMPEEKIAKKKKSSFEIIISDYDSNWKNIYQEEENKIKKQLGSDCIDVFHIGSTSVLDLAAKPIIDIISVVKDVNTVEKKIRTSRILL